MVITEEKQKMKPKTGCVAVTKTFQWLLRTATENIQLNCIQLKCIS